jgi:hypothetical protein
MNKEQESNQLPQLEPFERQTHDPGIRIRVMGSGEIGGKAHGLVILNNLFAADQFQDQYPDVSLGVPALTILRTDVFDAFLAKNDLYRFREGNYTDDQIAHAFQQSELPFSILGDLQALINLTRSPLAVRSSSLLEDATYEPFAGIYVTKMIPNHQFDPGMRFQKLSEAIKFVYASTFFRSARSYREATGHADIEEKMAVIIQDVHGRRHHVRFYPEMSGVARSYNYYPTGRSKPEDGVVSLALGLGKTIVDGGTSWSYSPSHPRVGPPYGSTAELLRFSQKEFWAINMGSPLIYDPLQETEYLVHENLATAEQDGTLTELCSTYDAQSDRLQPGLTHSGPRALTFAPLLQLKKYGFNEIIKELLRACQLELEGPVEIEFAMTFDPPSLGLVQVRSMVVSEEEIQLEEADLKGIDILAASDKVLGNGRLETISDIVYVTPEDFDPSQTQAIARELEEINQDLLADNRPYLLVVIGRLGSSDPWLGIPVDWGQISGTRVIIETYLDDFSVDMSQGSHFFHNLTSLGVYYLSMPRTGQYKLDWDWLDQQTEIRRTDFVRHIRLPAALKIQIDGRSSRGVIHKPGSTDD